MTNGEKQKYNLEERTSKFGESIVIFCKGIDKNLISDVLIKQIIRSGTSIGANYMEADCAESKKDFRHKIAICKKNQKKQNIGLECLLLIATHTKINAKIL